MEHKECPIEEKTAQNQRGSYFEQKVTINYYNLDEGGFDGLFAFDDCPLEEKKFVQQIQQSQELQ